LAAMAVKCFNINAVFFGPSITLVAARIRF
jgi:hypothetical protein